MKKYLIINPFGIGDVLFTTPVIRAIKEASPDTIIGYWCNERAAPLLRANPAIDYIFSLSRGDLKKIFQGSILEGLNKALAQFIAIRKKHFDICLDFSLDHRYSLVAKLAGIKRRVGFNYKKRGRFLTDKIDTDGYHSRHMVEYYLSLLRLVGIEGKNYNLELHIPQGSKVRIKALFSSLGIGEADLIIGIVPGAGESWGKDALIKHWPAVKFAQLSDRMIDGLKAKVLILGSSAEKPVADVILNTMKNKPVDLVGRTTLEELAAIIDNLDILIANDGGPLHMAAALGKKTVSFFGPVSPRVYGPYPADNRKHSVLNKGLECSPCYSNFRLSGCLNNKECLKSISVDEAMSAVSELLVSKERN